MHQGWDGSIDFKYRFSLVSLLHHALSAAPELGRQHRLDTTATGHMGNGVTRSRRPTMRAPYAAAITTRGMITPIFLRGGRRPEGGYALMPAAAARHRPESLLFSGRGGLSFGDRDGQWLIRFRVYEFRASLAGSQPAWLRRACRRSRL